jgi:hypothetical protein
MHEIICPHCQKAFTIDEAGYADIVRQVRNDEFQTELHERLAAAAQEKTAAIELAEAKMAASLKDEVVAKDAQIAELKATLDATAVAKELAIKEETAKKDTEIERLKTELKSAEIAERLAIKEAIEELEKERDAETSSLAQASAKKDAEIERLKGEIKTAEVTSQLAVKDATQGIVKERDDLVRDLKAKDLEFTSKELVLRTDFEGRIQSKELLLKDKDDVIERLRDLKTKLSTKMLGETLEQHCQIAFEQLRATAFRSATFSKDNTTSESGSKGDYIFRDHSDDGTEYISIMFEMKNEADATKTKQTSESFLKELDKDRNEKHCEYAVLVSLLEPESEIYNAGIVDVSHIYPKMYVIRPQFFIPMITLLRNSAQATIGIRSELARIQEQNLDITNFEARLSEFQTSFSKNVGDAAKQYDNAIDAIDAAIKKLEDTKDSLRLWVKHLNTASGKSDRLSIRALTKGNSTMGAKFASLAREDRVSYQETEDH